MKTDGAGWDITRRRRGMKKIILLLMVLVLHANAFCQDIIVKRNNETIKAKIIEVNQNDIKFRRWDNLDGPVYIIQKSDIASIVYQNGEAESFMSVEKKPSSNTKESQDIDVYEVIGNPNVLFKGECVHFAKNEYSSTSVYNPWIGRSTSTTYYDGYVFGENATNADRKELFYKIDNNHVAFLTHSQFKDYLKNHDYELFQKYNTGQGLFISGWIVGGIGWGADICALLWTMINFDGLYNIILPVGIVGAVFTLVGTPMLISGAVIRNKVVPKLYNAKYAQKNTSALTWSVGVMQNGVGFNLKF